MGLAQRDRSLLARIGFYLCREGRVPEAEDLFSGLAESAPEKDGPVIGLALCRTLMGEAGEAVAMLDARLGAGTPLAAEMMVYKVLALGMSGDTEKAKAVRAEMEAKGMGDSVKTADLLLKDLAAMDTP